MIEMRWNKYEVSLASPVWTQIIIIIIIIIMQRLTRHVSVIRTMNRRRRRGCHVDLRVAVNVIKRLEFLSAGVCSDVQVASDDVR